MITMMILRVRDYFLQDLSQSGHHAKEALAVAHMEGVEELGLLGQAGQNSGGPREQRQQEAVQLSAVVAEAPRRHSARRRLCIEQRRMLRSPCHCHHIHITVAQHLTKTSLAISECYMVSMEVSVWL